jgi:dihydroflavonol-4-reductase
VLVTGATGFLGSRICHRLAREGHAVTALRRPDSDDSPLAGLGVAQAIGDVTDFESVDRAVAGHDAVIHAAASIRYGASSKSDRDAQTRVNVGGTVNAAGASRKRGVARFIHVSSMAAIGIPPDADHPADETFPFNLRESGLHYHVSKWEAEAAVLAEFRAGLSAVIVNPGAIYGPFGSIFRGGTLLEKVRRQRVVPYYRGGINVVHVDDAVDGILRAIERGRPGTRYILGGENLTVRRIAETAAEILGVRRTFLPIPSVVTLLACAVLGPVARLTGRRPRVTREIHYCSGRYQYYDSSKAKNDLGFEARPFRAIAEECLSFRARPARRLSE